MIKSLSVDAITGQLMRNLKKVLVVLTSSVAAIIATAVSAHIDKNFDRNGGHYGPFGDYHCHQQGCRLAPSRRDFTWRNNRARVNMRDQQDFYLEDDWPHWMLVGQCQTIRTQILEATSEVPVTWTNPRQCEIREGKWTDPYTGEEFVRAARLELDHIIPPSYANVSNGFRWDDRTRMEFANDPLNLIPVSRDVYRNKRERPIASWRPPEENFHCEYAAAWRDISRKYDLDLFASDRTRMNNILKDCDIPEKDFESRENETDIQVNGVPIPL